MELLRLQRQSWIKIQINVKVIRFLLCSLFIIHYLLIYKKLVLLIGVIIFCVIGYGFVDFESPVAAEGAVKALVAKGIQAQMAKVGIWLLPRLPSVRWLCMQVQ